MECCPPTTSRNSRDIDRVPVPNLCPFAENYLTEIFLIQPTLCCSVIRTCTCLKECTVLLVMLVENLQCLICTYLYNPSK